MPRTPYCTHSRLRHLRNLAFALITILASLPLSAQGRAQARPAARPARQQPGGARDAAEDDKGVRVLRPGVLIERELAGGESHAYRITLAAGEYMQAEVEQLGVDAATTLRGPGGAPLAEINLTIERSGAETLSWEAAAAGRYTLEVRGAAEGAPRGRYRLRVGRKAAAGARERARIAAERRRRFRRHDFASERCGAINNSRPNFPHLHFSPR